MDRWNRVEATEYSLLFFLNYLQEFDDLFCIDIFFGLYFDDSHGFARTLE